jgi:glucose/arabinose dehydrogenase/PKD repeat protein
LRAHLRGGRRTALISLVALALTGLPVLLQAAPSVAATQWVQPGFNLDRTVDTSSVVPNPTDFVFLAGTNNFVAIGKCGQIGLGKMPSADGLSSTAWSKITWPSENTVTCAPTDRGLLGIDVDPGTATVYLLYNYTPTGGTCLDGSSAIAGRIYGRLTTLTMSSPTTPSSFSNEQVLMDCLPAFSADPANFGHGDDSHTIGTVLVAPDHTLFVGTGEASSYLGPDPSALNAQDVNSPRGKIFHLNPDGTPAAGNQYSGSYWADRVYAYGFRNPFRFTLQPNTNSTLYIGDVGWNNREEIDVSTGGENFGWPCYEGPLSYQPSGYSTMGACAAMYANPPANLTGPLYWWTHDGLVDGHAADGHAALGGVFAVGANYGSYSGAYFFGDLEWTRLWAFQPPASSGQLLGVCPGDAFACDLAPPANSSIPGVALTAMHQGPNKDVFINDIEGHRIIELRNGCGGNCSPVALATVSPTATQNVNTLFTFDASASSDSDGTIVNYHWNFGDGKSKDSSTPGATHTYGVAGSFTVTLTVTDNDGGTGSTTLSVTTAHSPPTITLTPNTSGLYSVAEPVKITATAKDDSGATIPGSSIQWAPVLHHCPAGVASGDCHIHPQDTPTGSSYSTAVPDHGDDSYLEFVATATDGNGLSATAHFNLPMDEHTVSLASTIPGVPLAVNGFGGPAPLTTKAITGSLNRVSVPTTFNGVPFVSWSDGDTNPTKTFTMPSADVSLTAIYASSSSPGAFTPVAPYRLFDTRNGASTSGAGSLSAGAEMAVDVSTQPTMPPGATGVLVNVTATNPAAAGYVRAYPCGTLPTNSTVNYDSGQTAANLAMVKLPANKRVCFQSLVPTDLVVDVAGWFSPPGPGAGSRYSPVDPTRVLDTRTGTKLSPNQELPFSLAGHAGFPAGATAALLNVTVTDAEDAGYVKVYPCGEEATISNVNYVAGQTVANLAAVKVAPGGQVCFKSFARADIVVDLAGWYAPGAGSAFVASDPLRLFDTRNRAQAPGGVVGPLPAGGELSMPVAGAGPVPANATAVALNVTAAGPTDPGYVKVYPCGTSPTVSNVNYQGHQVAAANLAVVKLPPDGRVCFSSFATTDLVVDLAGWYTA